MKKVRELGKLDGFGELALVDRNNKRSATVTCDKDSSFAVINIEDFSKFFIKF